MSAVQLCFTVMPYGWCTDMPAFDPLAAQLVTSSTPVCCVTFAASGPAPWGGGGGSTGGPAMGQSRPVQGLTWRLSGTAGLQANCFASESRPSEVMCCWLQGVCSAAELQPMDTLTMQHSLLPLHKKPLATSFGSDQGPCGHLSVPSTVSYALASSCRMRVKLMLHAPAPSSQLEPATLRHQCMASQMFVAAGD